MDQIARAWASFEADDYRSAEAGFRSILNTPGIDKAQQEQAQFGLGYALAFLGQYGEAREMFGQLYHHAGLRGEWVAEHRALHQVGMVERMAENWEAAQTCFERERQLIEQHGSPDLAVSVNAYELGLVALHLGQADVSRLWFSTCLTHAERTDDLIAVACAYRGLGDWFQHQGELVAASDVWEKALLIFQEADNPKAVREVQERQAALGGLGVR
ncbi:tol-pal system YbgF family protein [Deinococcus sp. AJ005]|uniref:tetratricopeptide repeat protein n=1 Tax=Deinococcus sp. AJ005 TaxID=2652443 RepID=UPI0018656CB1|nr:tetratricopeptide repeat protein [Deinococcus sp. AJ005]